MLTLPSRICEVSLEGPFSRNQHVERERALAVDKLVQSSVFNPLGLESGPYRLKLALVDGQLRLNIATHNRVQLAIHYLSLSPLRRLLKHYVLTCENYYETMPRASRTELETIEIDRRALHNDAAEWLRNQLATKVIVDGNTARLLFTLIYVSLMRNAPSRMT
ncbi:UPF0262 family protein [Mesorhizobium sp. M0976]|uniref:UPF0262 family protein n=1 Tax=Mesorhizobium sp. M0976 TaxID=2957038 RepID=UPI00333D634C